MERWIQNTNICSREREFQRPRACHGSWSYVTQPGVPRRIKKKKKKYSPPFIISHFRSICQYFFKNFFYKIFAKSFCQVLTFTNFCGIIFMEKRGGHTNSCSCLSPLNPPDLLLYHKELRFVNPFRKNFFVKFL